MTHMGCEQVRERLAAWVRSRPDQDGAVAAHLAGCSDCRAEAELLTALAAAVPRPPAELLGQVQRAVARERTGARHRRPWWALAAAAVAAVALGIGVNSGGPEGAVSPDVPIYAAEAGAPDAWLSVDGEIAGAPALDILSDEALAALLDELGGVGPGGAA